VDWSLNIGEHAEAIMLCKFGDALPSGEEDLLVLGEHTLFTITVLFLITFLFLFLFSCYVCVFTLAFTQVSRMIPLHNIPVAPL
jgi:hypothetical protein